MSLSRRLLLFGLLAALAAGATALDLMVLYPRRPNPGKGAVHRVDVPQGIGPRGLASLLAKEEIISSPGRFALWLRVSGALSRIKAGTFELSDRMTPAELVRRLSGRGVDKGVKVVFPEGATLSDMGDALEAAGVAAADAFLAAATDPSLVRKLRAPGPTFEGYLFPDTYYFETATEPREIVEKMYRTFLDHLRTLGIRDSAGLKDIVTLASIVQAETGLAQEMPVVAGVYRNRLKSASYPSKRLQADPTVSYGCEPFLTPKAPSCETFKGVLGRRQLDDPENPYNTYQHPGLPPGPISAPGAAALTAAHHPETVPFLYFVASPKGDGSHLFSVTLEEHQKAVDEYRNGRREARRRP
jgi:UPF0755 protein